MDCDSGIPEDVMSDPIIESVIEKLRSRSKVGMEKYGVGLNREDLSVVEWLLSLIHI